MSQIKIKPVWLIVLGLLFAVLAIEAGMFGIKALGPDAEQSILAISIDGKGLVKPGKGEFTYARGELVILEAVPEDGWTFSHWEGAGIEQAAPRIALSLDCDREVRVVFIEDLPQYYVLDIKTSGKGSVFPSPGEHHIDLEEAKEPITVIAEPDPGFTFAGWLADGVMVSQAAEYEFNLEQDISLTAQFTSMYSLEVESTEGGRVIAPAGPLELGKVVTVIARPDHNYRFVKWTEKGRVVSTSPTYSFTVEKAHNLKAHFAPYYYLQVSHSKGGSVYASHTGAVEGTRVRVSAVPDEGYAFVRWVDLPAGGSGTGSRTRGLKLAYIDQAVYELILDRNRSLRAEFAQVFPVAVSVMGQGTVKAPARAVNGARYMLVAEADQGFGFDQWTVLRGDKRETLSRNPVLGLNTKPDPTLMAHFLRAYPINVTAEPHDAGITAGGGIHLQDREITVRAAPAEYATFLGWYEGDVLLSPEPAYTFAVDRARNLTARFQPPVNIKLIASPVDAGAVEGTGKYTHGAQVAVGALPDLGYRFSHWEKEGVEVSDRARFSFTADEDCVLKAVFNKVGAHLVHVKATTGGTVRGEGLYTRGSTATVYAFSNTGYRFAYWTDDDGNIISDSRNYTFTVEGDCILKAHFLPVCMVRLETAVMEPEPGGTAVPGSVTGGGLYVKGSSVTVEAAAAYGYRFDRWETKDGEVLSTASAYTFEVNEDTELVARFVEAYPVKVYVKPAGAEGEFIPGEPGCITGAGFTYDESSFAGTGYYDRGSRVTLTAQSFENYVFVKWTERGRDLLDAVGKPIGPRIEFTVDGPRELCAHFRPGDYRVTANILPPGSGVVLGTGGYTAGESVSLTAMPRRGYELSSWEEEGSHYPGNPLDLGVISADRHLNVNFSKKPGYNIEAVAEPVAAGRVVGGGEWYSGEDVRLLAIANRGYQFSHWEENGELVSSDQALTFPAVGDRRLVARFNALAAYQISATAGPGGRVRGGGIYYEGETVILRAVPFDGFALVHWADADDSFYYKSRYSFEAASDRVLEARFTDEIKTVTARANDPELGSVSIDHAEGTTPEAGEATVKVGKGSQVELRAKPGSNIFKGWKIDGVLVSTEQNYRLTVEEDCEVVAEFEKQESCPFIYSFDGESYHFEHEAIPFALSKSMEYTSYGKLQELTNVDGAYHIRIAEERPEKSFLNGFQLTAVDYPAGCGIIKAMADINGKPRTVKEKIPPVLFIDDEGNNLTEKIKEESVFVGSSPEEIQKERSVDIYEAVFSRPEGATEEAKLMFFARNTFMNTGSWYWFMDTVNGKNNLWWIEELLTINHFQELFGESIRVANLRVELWDGQNWVDQGEIKAGRDLVEEYMVPLDLSLIEEAVNRIRVRFVFGKGLFEIGQVGIDFSEDEIAAVHGLKPHSSLKNGTADVKAALGDACDEQYVQMTEGDYIDLVYAAPPLDEKMERGFIVAVKGYYHIDPDGREYPAGGISSISGWLKSVPDALKAVPGLVKIYRIMNSVYLQPLEVKMEEIYIKEVLPWVEAREGAG